MATYPEVTDVRPVREHSLSFLFPPLKLLLCHKFCVCGGRGVGGGGGGG